MTHEEKARLEAALQQNVDLHGGDPSLALQVAEMSEACRRQSRKNVDDCIAELRANAVIRPSDRG